jgi:hypothetical protein
MNLRRDRSVVALAFTILVGLGAAGVGSLAALGLPILPSDEEPVGPTGPLELSWSTTSAYRALTDVLTQERPDWVPTSDVQPLAASSLPTSCLTGLTGPTGSLTRTFTLGPDALSVTLAAYSAGAGAGAYAALGASLGECGDTSLEPAVRGVEATKVVANVGGAPTTTEVWRRGDVVAYVGATNPAVAASSADALDASLDAALAPVCVNQQSVTAESVRSPWLDRAAYAGLTEERPVRVSAPALPSLPADQAPATPASPDPAATAPTKHPVVETPIPAPLVEVARVEVPEVPDYPVWPPLPAATPEPSAPSAPTEPVTTGAVLVSLEDTLGPGCGWSFAGTGAPAFDSSGVEAKEASDKEALTAQLEAGKAAWQESVLAYWRDHATYLDAVDSYRVYGEEVSVVNAAWDAIALQWDAYNAALRDYNRAVANRDSFLADQRAAQTRFDRAVAACQAPPRTETITPSPTTSTIAPTSPPTSAPGDEDDEDAPSSQPTSAPSPSVTVITPPPTTRVVNPPACPTRPSILDRAAPGVPERPTPPADPRPTDQRG